MTEAADYTHDYDPSTDFDRWYTLLTARRIAPLLEPNVRVLELGSACGDMTQHFCGDKRQITCIERSRRYAERARARALPGVVVREATIDGSLDLAATFDHIIAANLLHELPDPLGTVRHLLPSLAPGGQLHVTLPNPNSLHRLAAVAVGMLSDTRELSDRGRRLHTLRLQHADDVAGDFRTLGLFEVRREAILVKPLPNAAMAAVSSQIIEAWGALASNLPDHGAMMWLVFSAEAPVDA